MASPTLSPPPASVDTAAHALYVLLDSNLPTGGFVASSGLESYAKHGFLSPSRAYGVADAPDIRGARAAPGREWGAGRAPQSAAPLGPSKAGPALAQFAAAEVDNFAASTAWYLREAWACVRAALAATEDGPEGSEEPEEPEGTQMAVARLVRLDEMHEATLLSHVARRASRAQGVALLTLYARGLSAPPGVYEADGEAGCADGTVDEGGEGGDARAAALVAAYKRAVRRGAPGHLAVCFGAVCAALGIDYDTAHHLYLFTHARSLLSAAVRLNVVGPYLSTQLLAHPLRRTIAGAMKSEAAGPETDGFEGEGGDEWAWAEEAERGPATTWPLGEILAARHDLQHSRIFNS
ncbi:hypothetical protein CC85DRAFT_275987 [Cutaneotrichosporon oleaginosum]|uniref:Urease accessory protein UreF n=1 Tax=Cutaneotrichosporon oleaginosum TaxID=879819 RepID=A0A0J0XK85_9TREE|nr:uncharacterized protein CC85DRAFT_275987 [Cutaneotrichosporon oleaginosum]KLT41506.1 hypothetical protein CC85DRAFT_275987 [Cutaneotrichosporon oleaginosum]TXT05845.1 hypothetical protein COLE_07165 [Cutaneotrichosporon oleaginosum]